MLVIAFSFHRDLVFNGPLIDSFERERQDEERDQIESDLKFRKVPSSDGRLLSFLSFLLQYQLELVHLKNSSPNQQMWHLSGHLDESQEPSLFAFILSDLP